ncbi:MAG: CPBP family intramembrane glutamate endopeptidase, partial [Leptolyngbyaceae bacterium]|nr:CPBP family intramembrane glutamate endopeptidase [Leptolyngbyaceae bacterium]
QPPAIVIHAFGGIGGEKAEPKQLWTTTGHFSYGIATVVLDPLTNQPRLWIEYYQVYANNPSGIVSGVIHWSDYMGHLQRGWLGTRPVSDVLVSLDVVTQPYQFDTIVINPLAEFKRQLVLMAARYRTGNGTGAAIVTPSTSCVQDSNQALYATIQSVENQIQTNPTIQQWLNAHPDHPQTQRFQSLVELGHMLENQLTPLGLVRSDWQENAEALAGIGDQPNWSINRSLLSVLRSWRTLLPRRAHDELTLQLLTLGHTPMHIIRTNQIGGDDPTIEPLAPTTLLGF